MSRPNDPVSNSGGSAAWLAAVSAALFAVSAGFMLFLSSGTLADLSRRVHLSAYQRMGERFRVSLERGLRFGRPLDGYAGLRERLDNARMLAEGLDCMAVIDAAGRLAAQSGSGLDGAPPDPLPGDPEWRDRAGRPVLTLPLTGREKRLEGYLLLSVNPERIRMERERFWKVSLGVLAVMAIALTLGLSGWVANDALPGQGGRLARRRYRLCLLFAGGAQVLYCCPLLWFFAGALSDAEGSKLAATAKVAAWDLETLLAKGVRLDEVGGMQSYFDEMRLGNPEILAVSLSGRGYATRVSGSPPSSPPPESRAINVYWPDRYTPWRREAILEFWLNPAGVRDALWTIGRNLATALVVSLLFLNEMARFLTLSGPGKAAAAPAAAGSAAADASRMLAFLFFMAYDMSMSFVPLFAASLPGEAWPFPKSFASALPLTAEAAAVGLGTLLAGRALFGLSPPAKLRLGLGAAMAGSLLSGMAPTILFFCLARAAAGFGFGVFLMVCQLILLPGENRAGNLGGLFSGVLSGSMAGLAAGAMSAELLGFGHIFPLSVPLFLPALLMTGRVASGRGKKGVPVPKAGERTVSAGGRAGFYASPAFLGQVLLIAIPATIIQAGLVYYSLPVLLERMGTAQGDIGRVLMLQGLCFILAGPVLGRRADSGRNYATWIAAAGLLNALATLLLWLWPSLAGYALAAVACGIGGAAMISSGMARITALAAASGVREDSASGIYRFAERLGHMAGPVVFGLCVGGGNGDGFLWLFAAFLLGVMLFLAIGKGVSLRREEG